MEVDGEWELTGRRRVNGEQRSEGEERGCRAGTASEGGKGGLGDMRTCHFVGSAGEVVGASFAALGSLEAGKKWWGCP